jgi:DNA-binding CsgD family transcriptional regulator
MTASPTTPASPTILLSALSEREQAVLRLLAQGYANKEIAYELKLSKNVVEKILSNSSPYSVYPKIGVTNAKSAIAWYLKQAEDVQGVEMQTANRPETQRPSAITVNNAADSGATRGGGSWHLRKLQLNQGVLRWFLLILIGVAALGATLALILARLPGKNQSNMRGEIQMVGDEGRRIRVEANDRVLSADEIVPAYTPIRVAFQILNNGTGPITLRALTIGVRGPGVTCHDKNTARWSAPDVPFPAATNLTLQPGEKYEYRGIRAIYLPGIYFFEPVMQDTTGNWGGIPPFSCVSLTVVDSK